MRQGILTQGRMCLLLSKGHSSHRLRGTGEWKREFADALWMPI
ncbi:rCG55469 [Rattus norvegicus]|uniref:RCG55469 n=1 Tax=Rattus norvegicus TaxID=10116 RepID=A6JRB5_RAT|nr:rCG55469 [Rattus norvegicus]